MSRISIATLFAIVLATTMLAGGVRADDDPSWPQFLGPDRNGVSAETGLFQKWPQEGLPEVWRVDGGVGMSGCAIHEGRLITMVQRGGKQTVVALDAATGKSLWKQEIAPEYKNQMGDGPRATPAISNGTAFVFTGEGVLAALNVEDGAIKWRVDAVKKLDGRVADYGMASSPLVVGNTVVVTVGAPEAAVAGFDRTSGKLQWKVGNERTGYSSPALLTLSGKEQILAYCGTALLAVDPKNGEKLWHYSYITDYDCNIAMPVAYQDHVFISSGENHGCVLLSLAKSGNGWSSKPVWKTHGAKSAMRNEWQTSVLIGDYLYGFDNVGSAGPVTHLNCVNIKTGERVWQQKRFGKGNLIAADGKLLIVTVKGELVAVRATPKQFEELGRMSALGFTRQAPALAGGRLYLRDDKEIICLDARQK